MFICNERRTVIEEHIFENITSFIDLKKWNKCIVFITFPGYVILTLIEHYLYQSKQMLSKQDLTITRYL